MESDLRVLAFDVWVDRVFGDGVIVRDDDDSDLELPSIVALEYATALFERSGALLHRFSDSNVDLGLRRVVSEGDNHLDALFDEATPDAARIRFVDSIERVYTDVFAARCEPVLCHLDEEQRTPLNGVCYMWWDTFPTWGKPRQPIFRNLDAAIIDLLRRLLSIEHDACLESALHGLGHWQLHYPREVATIIDAFLSRATGLRSELRDYAANARSGMVL